MARGRPRKQKDEGRGATAQAATTGYEAELWRMADALRGSMDAAEYKHVVFGLIFLKDVLGRVYQFASAEGNRAASSILRAMSTIVIMRAGAQMQYGALE